MVCLAGSASAQKNTSTNYRVTTSTFSGTPSVRYSGTNYKLRPVTQVGGLFSSRPSSSNYKTLAALLFDTDITAVKLSFATLPSDIIHLQPFTVVVNAVDASGTLDADFQSTINLAISSGTLSTTVATAILGAATFSGITVNGAGSNRVLDATTPINLTAAMSSPFSIGKAQATVTLPTLEATLVVSRYLCKRG